MPPPKEVYKVFIDLMELPLLAEVIMAFAGINVFLCGSKPYTYDEPLQVLLEAREFLKRFDTGVKPEENTPSPEKLLDLLLKMQLRRLVSRSETRELAYLVAGVTMFLARVHTTYSTGFVEQIQRQLAQLDVGSRH